MPTADDQYISALGGKTGRKREGWSPASVVAGAALLAVVALATLRYGPSTWGAGGEAQALSWRREWDSFKQQELQAFQAQKDAVVQKLSAAVSEVQSTVQQQLQAFAEQKDAAAADKLAGVEKTVADVTGQINKLSGKIDKVVDATTATAAAVQQPAKGATIASTTTIDTEHFMTADVGVSGLRAKIAFPRNEQYLGGALRQGKVHEGKLVSAMLNFIQEGDVVVDVGANFGMTTVFYAQKAGRTGRVHSFEPQALMVQLLGANSVMNDLLNVDVYHTAVGHTAGDTNMARFSMEGESKGTDAEQAALDTSTKHSYASMQLGVGGEKVPMITLDSLPRLRNVAAIKVDTEGTEPLVFYGAQELIKQAKPVIQWELGKRPFPKELQSFMNIPDEITKFNVTKFALSLGYKAAFAGLADQFLIPPQHWERAREAGMQLLDA